MLTLVRSVQFWKAYEPMAFTVYVVPLLVTVPGMVTLPVYFVDPATTETILPFLSVML